MAIFFQEQCSYLQRSIPATRIIGEMSQANDTFGDMRTEIEMTVVSPALLATTR
jgi:hypothetical protein